MGILGEYMGFRFIFFVLVSTVLFMPGCDATYRIRGTVYGKLAIETNLKDPLSSAEVAFFYLDDKGREVLYKNELTDINGSYEFFFVGPPGGLGDTESLEIRKNGYAPKRIIILKANNETNVELTKCDAKKSNTTYCWTVNVTLKPIGELDGLK